MKLVLAGASGFLGTAWRDHLAREGHEVVRLVRGEALSASESSWDPYAGKVDRSVIEAADVVVDLSGAPLAHWPWTESYKQHASPRAGSPRPARSPRPSPPRTASPPSSRRTASPATATAATRSLTEDSAYDADTFMGGVTRAWQDATTPASDAGARVAVLRSGVILDKRGGALKPLLLVFKAGLGGPVGTGHAVLLHDLAVRLGPGRHPPGDPRRLLAASTTSRRPTRRPTPSSAATLGRMLHRPSVLPAPAWPIRKVVGDISSELLNSTRVEPRAAAGRRLHVRAPDPQRAARGRPHLTGRTADTRQAPSAPRASVTARVSGWSRGSGTRRPRPTATAPASRSVTRSAQPRVAVLEDPQGEHLRPHPLDDAARGTGSPAAAATSDRPAADPATYSPRSSPDRARA